MVLFTSRQTTKNVTHRSSASAAAGSAEQATQQAASTNLWTEEEIILEADVHQPPDQTDIGK